MNDNNPIPGVTLAGEIKPILDQDIRINRISWSRDGKVLAAACTDNVVRLWSIDAENDFRAEAHEPFADHHGEVYGVVWSYDGSCLASGSADGCINLRDPKNHRDVRRLSTHNGPVFCLAFYTFDKDTPLLAAGYFNGKIIVWNVKTRTQSWNVSAHHGAVNTLSWSHDGKLLASGGDDGRIRLWDFQKKEPFGTPLIEDASGSVLSVSWDSLKGTWLASGSRDGVIRIWDPLTGRLKHRLEGHTGLVSRVAVSRNSRYLASKSQDNSVRLWRCNDWASLGALEESAASAPWHGGLVFNPAHPLLATLGARDEFIRIWKLDSEILLNNGAEPSAHYVNAKVVLVGDTGVGKSGLSLVLNNEPFEPTDSTAGRYVWTLDSREARSAGNVTQTRETLLWDLAGQPGYRVIHQLYLNEVTVALVVFDARSETDPLAGVRHWERALRLAHQRKGGGGVPMKKFLVSARNDRGVVSVSKDRIQALIEEHKFDGYFETSAKEGWKIAELRTAIEQAIPWDDLPEVSSSQLFADIKAFLVKVKETGRLLALPEQLYGDFIAQHPDSGNGVTDLRAQFDTCIGRLEARDLIRRLSFGRYVLLQPELLDAYASAMVNMAKDEPDGLGSLSEEVALGGKFYVPQEHKITDAGQEQLLLHATVEELMRHDLALRENANNGRYLIFPSQFNRDYEDVPEPKGKEVAITFAGPVQSLYATLAVRLGHSGLFTTGRAEMWRNAAIFTAKAGGKCGLFVNEFSEGRGRLILFYDEHASQETRFHFEEYVLAHTARRSLEDSVALVRFFVCPDCGEPVPDAYVKTVRSRGRMTFNCPCGGAVSLAEPKERIHFKSKVEAMDQSADRQRDFDAFVMSAKGETTTESFREWASGERVTLGIVFTDVVGSTALGEELLDSRMNEVRRAHFEQSRKLIGRFHGREIKTIGDSFMVAFKNAGDALDYAIALQQNTGHPSLQIRAGIHIGPIHVEEGDVFGGTVNFAARVVGAIEKRVEIWLSDRAKEDIDRLGAEQHARLRWERHEDVPMKGFPGKFTLWSLTG
jgi:class 3 adenylate cyclase/GTPase SAR1 family protein